MIFMNGKVSWHDESEYRALDMEKAFDSHIEDVVLKWGNTLLYVWGKEQGANYDCIGKALQDAMLLEVSIDDDKSCYVAILELNGENFAGQVAVTKDQLEVWVCDHRYLTPIGSNFQNADEYRMTSEPFYSVFRMTHETMGVEKEVFDIALACGQVPKPFTSNVLNLGTVDFSTGVIA
jgi:hypothetical protein